MNAFNYQSCCACPSHRPAEAKCPPAVDLLGVSRREFIGGMSLLTSGALMLSSKSAMAGQPAAEYAPARRPLARQTLKVQPVLVYSVPTRRYSDTWRPWGGIQTEEDAKKERERLLKELEKFKSQTGFPLEIAPMAMVKTNEEAAAVARGLHDVLLLYAAGGSVKMLETITDPQKWNVMFLRHDPGPVYLWYEIVSPRFLRKTVDDYGQPGWDPYDVVVDKHEDVLCRLRALSGLKNTLGKKIVCIGGPGGWGAGGKNAAARSKELWKMELVNFPYKEMEARIKTARQNSALVAYATKASKRFLRQGGLSLHTGRDFVVNSFILTEIFKDLLDEHQTDAITINSCMRAIMPLAETTACLTLSVLNDEGYMAFCESDFVVIPSGVLLHYISGLPVFLNDPTYPHDGVVTLAHCTSPRKMDGKKAERTKVLTHFESDYGAAPKVEMRIGQVCTNLVPDFASKKWLGFQGTIVGNPFLDICRSQVDVRINGDGNALMEQMKGFHWMMSYGDYMKECAYALRKAGVEFVDLSAGKMA